MKHLIALLFLTLFAVALCQAEITPDERSRYLIELARKTNTPTSLGELQRLQGMRFDNWRTVSWQPCEDVPSSGVDPVIRLDRIYTSGRTVKKGEEFGIKVDATVISGTIADAYVVGELYMLNEVVATFRYSLCALLGRDSCPIYPGPLSVAVREKVPRMVYPRGYTLKLTLIANGLPSTCAKLTVDVE
jgi:hypothetical protein